MNRRKVSERGRSLYLNLPKSVVDTAGLKAGDLVDIRYVEGIGIIVSMPIRIPIVRGKGMEVSLHDIKFGGRSFMSYDGKTLDVIPLYDGIGRIK